VKTLEEILEANKDHLARDGGSRQSLEEVVDWGISKAHARSLIKAFLAEAWPKEMELDEFFNAHDAPGARRDCLAELDENAKQILRKI